MKKLLISTLVITLLWGCGGGSSKKSTIDVAEYFPKGNMSKSFLTKTSASLDPISHKEDISVDNNKITVMADGVLKQSVTIGSDSISQIDSEDNLTRLMKRFIAVGEILYTLPKSTLIKDIEFEGILLGQETIESKKVCRLEKQINDILDFDIFEYDGEILKFKCIEDKTIVTDIKDNLPDYITLTDGEKNSDYDISYFYMKQGEGIIVEIDDDCIVEDRDGMKIVDDNSKRCIEEHYIHKFSF